MCPQNMKNKFRDTCHILMLQPYPYLLQTAKPTFGSQHSRKSGHNQGRTMFHKLLPILFFTCRISGQPDIDRWGHAHFIKRLVDSGDAEPLPSDPITQNGMCIGYITSTSAGYRINQCIALGYIDAARDDSDLTVQVLGNHCPIRVVTGAFYGPENNRCKS